MKTEPVTFKTDAPIDLKMVIPAFDKTGAWREVEVSISWTKELLNIMQTDQQLAAFMMMEFIKAYAIRLQADGGSPV